MRSGGVREQATIITAGNGRTGKRRIGLVGGSTYVAARKGKDVDQPAQTGMSVRLDTNLSLPDAATYQPPAVLGRGN
jgi:hypothetical protein